MAALHTELLKRDVFRDFDELWPERFNNKTNGVTPRRWLLKGNPRLAALITEAIGAGWVTDLDELARARALRRPTRRSRPRGATVKRENKDRLAETIVQQYRHRGTALTVDPDALFDVQVKRIHEYKRQLLNVAARHRALQPDPGRPRPTVVPRTVIFGGKAAPGYTMAKLIIRLINAVPTWSTPTRPSRGRLKVVFLPDYRVSLAELIIPPRTCPSRSRPRAPRPPAPAT